MSADGRIPIVIGVSGHLEIAERDRDAVYASVLKELEKIKNDYPSSPVRLICSLARGGDTICARAAKSLSIPYTAVLPFDQEEFRKDFHGKDLEEFDELLKDAQSVFVNPLTEEPCDDSRDYYYRQNGIYIATMCHVLMALWDGNEEGSDGCGTAAAVRFALKGSYKPEKGIPVRNAGNSMVVRIVTPRENKEKEKAGDVIYLGSPEEVRKALAETDDYNRRALELSAVHPEAPLDEVYAAADRLSLKYQKSYLNTLRAVAAAGTVMMLTFMLYDCIDLALMLFLTIVMIGCCSLIIKRSKDSGCLGLYISYRALAEASRVRSYLRYAGCEVPVSALMNTTQQTEKLWIMLA